MQLSFLQIFSTERLPIKLWAFVVSLATALSGLLFFSPEPAQAAVPTAPVITSVSRVDQGLNIAFTAPSGVTPAITNYEYSVDGGATWVARNPASTASPISITGLTNCQTYSVAIRAVNTDGSGVASEAWGGVPGSLTYQLDNGLMRFGNGAEASILGNGNLKQPWYFANGSWSKLTFSNYALNFAMGVGGVGTNEWNVNGSLQEFSNVTLSRQSIDCSQFVTTSTNGTLATGYGTLTMTGRFTFSTGEVVELTRKYTQTSTSKYTIFSESIRNVGTSTMSNARVWVGTQDDWVGQNDSNAKKRGNIVNGVFTQISSAANQAKVLEISNGTDNVYFYTTSNLGYVTGLNGYGDFNARVMQQNPATAQISVTNDGSYGMYLRFQDIPSGASEAFTWYYIASTAANASALLGTVAAAALPTAPTINSITPGNSQASVDFTPGSAGGSALTNYQYSTNGGVSWQTRSPASTTSPLVITGLSNNQLYNVQIRAVNSEGSGTASATSSVTPVGPPQAPQITSIDQTSTTATVGFTAPGSDGGSAITGYEYSVDGGVSWSTTPTISNSQFTITGLTAGTSYSVALRALNTHGSGTSSASQSVTTHGTPGAPHINSITGSDGSLSVDITLGSTGGTPVTNLEYSLDGGQSWITRSPTSTYLPLYISGLTNGTNYDIRVRAVNYVGQGTQSNLVVGRPVSSPGAVSLSGDVVASSHTLTLTITPPVDGGSAITGYEYSTDRGATWRARQDLGGTTTTLAVNTLSTDGSTLLTNGTEYCVQVRAVNSVGAGLASADLCSIPKTVPDAPSVISTTGRDRAIDVTYLLGGNGGSPITQVEYCLNACGTLANWISIGLSSSPFRISGLTNGTSYTVDLRSVNSVGTSATSTLTYATAIPADIPTPPVITSVVSGAGQVTINFTAPTSDGGFTINNYQYSRDGGITWNSVSPGSTALSILVTGLTNGTNYGFSIRAITSQTIGQASAVSYATPSTTPSAPVSPVVSPLSTRLALSFITPDDGGSPITTYQYSLSTNGGSSYGSWISTNTTSTKFTISGLVNGTPYFVKIRGVNLNGNGAEYTTAIAVTPAAVPESPVISRTENSQASVSLTAKQIAVYFTEPANNGSTITNYQYSTDGGITWRNRTDTTGRLSPIVITLASSDGTVLTSAATYPIQIRAVNSNGSGDASQTVSATTGGVADTVFPTVSVSKSGASATTSNSRTFSYTATFSEQISGLAPADFVQSSGTATCTTVSVTPITFSDYTINISCSSDGTVAMKLLANSVTDGANIGPVSDAIPSTVTIDSVVPQAAINSPAANSPSRTLTYSVDFTEQVSGIAIADFVKSSGTASCSTIAVSVASGTSATFTVLCTTDGTIVMALSAGSVTDGINVAPAVVLLSSSTRVDTVPPTATLALTGGSSTTSSSRTLNYVATFSETVSGIGVSDFVKTSGTALCSTTSVSALSGSSITVTVTCTTDGTVVMQLAANSVTDGIFDGPSSAVTASSVLIDTAIAQVQISGTSSSTSRTLIYTVEFTEQVSGIAISDFVKSSGTATCSTIAASATSGISVTFTVLCTTDGTVVMALTAGSVTDGINVAPASSALANSVSIDTSVPTVVLTTPTSPSTSRLLTYVATFSESVSGVSAADFVKQSGTANCSTTSISAFSGSQISFTVTCTSDGTIRMQLLANSVTDGVNSGPAAAVVSGELTVDQDAPAVTITVDSTRSSQRTNRYALTFSESISGLELSDFVQQSGTNNCFATALTISSGTSASFTVSCLTDGTVVMGLTRDSVTDGIHAGPTVTSLSPELTIDTTAPVIAPRIVAPQPTQNAPLPVNSPSPIIRVPTYLNGELPKVATSSPLLIISGMPVAVESSPISSGGQQISLPSGATVTLDTVSDRQIKPAVENSQGVMQISHGDTLKLEATGLQPGSEIEVWFFSTPKLLGTVIVDLNGNAKAEFIIPSNLHVGKHTAQVDGVDGSGTEVSVNTAVLIAEETSTSPQKQSGSHVIAPQNVIFIGAGILVVAASLFLLVLVARKRRKTRG